jgi:hypothetical protein
VRPVADRRVLPADRLADRDVLAGTPAPPQWALRDSVTVDPGEDVAVGEAIRGQYAAVRDRTHPETARG